MSEPLRKFARYLLEQVMKFLSFLGIEDLQDLLAVLSDVHFDETKWHDLGLSLRLPEPDLETIEDKYSDSHVCLRKCLSLWLKKSENALPQVLASALDDTRISEPRAAERVRKLCKLKIYVALFDSVSSMGCSVQYWYMYVSCMHVRLHVHVHVILKYMLYM